MESFPFLNVFRQRQAAVAPRGFTLIEMLVVISIIAVISAVVLTGQSAYNQSLILTDTTYMVAFSARQAQSLGLSSRNFGIAGTGGQNVGYGLNFSSGSPDRYTVFADTVNNTLPIPTACAVGVSGYPEFKPGNCRFNGGDGILQTYVFSRGYTIGKFCAKNGTGSSAPLVCSDTGLQSLDVVFMRPNTETVITGSQSGNSSVPFSCAEIHVKAPTGNNVERLIRISSLGEISIGQTCP